MRCEQCDGPMWDNREDKKNPNSPDYKCKDKDCGHAVWLTAKDDPSRKTAKRKTKSAEGPSERDTYWADKTSRDVVESLVLRRQSAQTKALAYARMAREKPTLKEVLEWTDHFEQDAMAGVRKAKAAALQGKLEAETVVEPDLSDMGEDEIEI